MPLSPDDELPGRDDFVAFLHDLRRDFEQRGGEWENATLDRFLEGMASWVASSDGWYRNFGRELPPGGDWTFFARALMAARIYE
ncbi:hypothetical protein [Streptomyces sp. NPDC088725]|uniref:DUF7660 family protein n=1 Tax=Streptomyces sp. NPDC088725 TaxID=3365873 RepID=UPI003816FA94